MTGDKWLEPGTCGVKLTEFDAMTRQMTQAGPALADLADQLWQALHGAGVSTAPAMEIKRIAAWAEQAATDLRRRDQLAHDLGKQRIAMEVSRQDGIFLVLPDKYTDQVAYADGRRTADLFRRAADGDASARAALLRIKDGDITPAFAKGLLEGLGPTDLLELPMDLTNKLAGDINRHRDPDAGAADTRALLALLGRSLALGTTTGKGYVGDEYLSQLRAAGRTRFPPLSTPPNGTSGYQAVATLLAAAGTTRFSTKFFDTVGNDMITYDQGLRKTLGDRPLPDLTGKLGLGNALDPSTTKVKAGERHTDFLAPLLTAAANSGKAASQTLLTYVRMGPVAEDDPDGLTERNLTYLLHTRRPVWAATDHGAALGKTLQAAASGHDETSTALAFEAAKLLSDDARKNFKVSDGKLTAGDKGKTDALSGVRPAMASVLVSHMDELHGIVLLSEYSDKIGSTGLSGDDLDYLLLDVTRDAGAYQTLLKGETAHAKLAVDDAIAHHHDLSNTIAGEGHMFGHILEARHQTVGGEEARLAADLAAMKQYVGYGVALIPLDKAPVAKIPGAAVGYGALTSALTSQMTDYIAKKLADKADPTIMAPTTETEAVEKLFGQMVVSSMVAHGRVHGGDLAGRPFATKGPHAKVRPIESLSGEELGDLLSWANVHLKLGDVNDKVQDSLRNGQVKTAGHYKGSDGKNVNPSVQR